MIESIEFTNFKALRKTTLPLAPFTLLLGPNGSGKTSVLQALQGIATIAAAPARLWLFLVFSSTRPGVFPGYVLVIDDQSDKAIFYGQLTPPPAFEADIEIVVNVMRLRCSFPQPGRYTVQIWFFQKQGRDVLKGELPFTVSTEGA